jgi:hypothetical protein
MAPCPRREKHASFFPHVAGSNLSSTHLPGRLLYLSVVYTIHGLTALFVCRGSRSFAEDRRTKTMNLDKKNKHSGTMIGRKNISGDVTPITFTRPTQP